MSQWGSGNPNDDADNTQACSNRKLVAVIRPEDTIPLVVDLAPTSVKLLSQFLLRLAGRGIPCYGAVIGLGLANEDSRTGITYSVVKPRLIAKLSDQDCDRFEAVAESFKPIFQQIELVQETSED